MFFVEHPLFALFVHSPSLEKGRKDKKGRFLTRHTTRENQPFLRFGGYIFAVNLLLCTITTTGLHFAQTLNGMQQQYVVRCIKRMLLHLDETSPSLHQSVLSQQGYKTSNSACPMD
jgi:hypothetical protein